MILIKIDPKDFEYDVMSLVQAFFPGEQFKVNKDIEEINKDNKEDSSGNNRAVSCASIKYVNVYLLKDSIRFCINIDDNAYESIAECDFSDRRQAKNTLKKELYRLLSSATKKVLPWGNLTGIRPAKIPALLFNEGKDEAYIRQHMIDTYDISSEKLELAIAIAKRENEILNNINYKENYSLYIGIPFCPTTCLYCSFTSYPIALYENKVDKYIDAMVKEMDYLAQELKDKELNTVYIGGGTPTTLSPNQLKRLITELKNHFDLSRIHEFTVEAGRPDSITREKLEVLKECGVDRISINPQTMNQDTLELIGRNHTVTQVIDTFKLAREVGFTNINMDLIIGLPQEDEQKVLYTFDEIKKLNPDSLTVHSLAVKRAARLNTDKEKYENMVMENSTGLMELSVNYAKQMGMEPYYLYRQKNMAGNQENVGYSRIGCEGIYNILMMGDKQNIIAIGAGATTKMMTKDRLSATRIDSLKNVDLYIERIDEIIERKREYLANNEFYVDND